MDTKNNTSGQYNSTREKTGNEQESGFNMESLTGMLGGLNIGEAVKKYGCSATKAIKGLSTTQKVVGGALLLLGATYLTRRKAGAGWLKNMAGNMAGAGKSNKKRR